METKKTKKSKRVTGPWKGPYITLNDGRTIYCAALTRKLLAENASAFATT